MSEWRPLSEVLEEILREINPSEEKSKSPLQTQPK
jgi:hypothetical protein